MASNNHLSGLASRNRNGFTNSPAANTNANLASGFNFNPAMLLNPRGFTGTPMNNTGNDHTPRQNGSGSSGSLDFHFSSPNDGTTSSASTPPSFASQGMDTTTASHTPTPVNGFGNMFERMNNVQDRSAVPQVKRRKVESEDNGAHHKNFAAGGSGTLGQYMKDKRDEAAKNPALRRVDTVDLTETVDDDSDVVDVEEVGKQEICYGLLQGARINCDIVPSPKPGQRSLSDSYWPQVKIMLYRKHGEATSTILAKDYTRQVVGRLDSHTANGLASLLDAPLLYLRTDCKIPSRLKKPGEQVGQQISEALHFDLILYGPRKSGRHVAKHLLNRGLHLGHPTRVDPGIKYDNPQRNTQPQAQAVVKAHFVSAPNSSAYPQVQRTVEEIRNEVMGVFDSLTKSEDLPQMEPDARITTELLQHQKQGLYFMTTKERPRELDNDGKTKNSFWQIRLGNNGQRSYNNVITGQTHSQPPPETYGGILADMMGLGKTLSILSLIVSSLGAAEEWSKAAPEQPRAPPPPRKNGQSSFNVPTPAPLALTSPTRNSGATLLVCPLSTVTNWEEQIKQHVKPGTFRYYIYHGPNRIKDPKKLAQFNLVITTYGSVSSEVKARQRGGKGPHPLEDISWFRVVLDEAHMIREQSTLLFKAICRLQANRRWAVTGTPVQNKLDDLAALLAFIRLKPFDNKTTFTQHIVAPFKVCDAEIVPKLRVLVDSVTLRRLKDKIDLPPRTDHIVKLKFSPSEDKIYRMFEQSAHDKVNVLTAGREKMLGGRTYIHILQSILRLRLISAHGKDLLSDEDLELVQGMTEDSAIDIDSDDDDEAGKPAVTEARAYAALELMQETNSDNCFVCSRAVNSNANDSADVEREDNVLGYLSACFHLICASCKPTWERAADGRASGTCPYCETHVRFDLVELRKDRAEVEHDAHHNSGNKTKTKALNATGYSGPHTKTRALLDDLLQSKAKSEAQPNEPPYKSVVFSGWTSHLDLIQTALDEVGIRYTRLDGKMSRPARATAMDRFREDPSVHVILVSIMAGGLGLNLTSGNSVYVMEPQYNPAAEAQAVDRVHRIGQKRPVRTVRYIMENSIEEKMLVLQDKKTKLANLSMDRGKVMDKAEAARQKLMDLRSLFR
ncbi:SNF2 family domain-containing protein [Xylariales sp. AK1849]|nr:SNF2 family domain-containing protein [Xylariales sp. AK1849]